MKYCDYLLEEMVARGYTHCFFVAGGNIMHLLDAARKRFTCIPVVHEVAAGIAAEYFNEENRRHEKAFALVTAGPGLTNIVTSIAGAYLESRELLVIGGQVKTSDLKNPEIRQRGIQEIDGQGIVKCITVKSEILKRPVDANEVFNFSKMQNRPGPIFLEIPLDVQAAEVNFPMNQMVSESPLNFKNPLSDDFIHDLVIELKTNSRRPILLLGGGLTRESAIKNIDLLSNSGIPIMTTWNGMDRYGSNYPNYWGRPNTWGQRASNILIQQSDLVIAIGTRLGLQQTGFAWEEFAPLAKIYQVDIDAHEINKGHPRIHRGIATDAGEFLEKFLGFVEHLNFQEWLSFGNKVLSHSEVNEKSNRTRGGFVSPYHFVETLSHMMSSNDVLIPCSSGGAFTVTMQAFNPKFGQTIITNKGLASMGYGLSGAIGASMSSKKRTVLIEGDGGFAQNLQELGTAARNKLNMKIFIFSNEGYASIRMTQRNYFQGNYIGCDVETGLGIPNWEYISKAYDVNYRLIDGDSDLESILQEILESENVELIEVKIDPEQTYFPKITSRILPNGEMASNPLHLMSPDLSDSEIREYLPYLADTIQKRA